MRNPTRRNRNIGTAKQGHGNNNKLTIPGSYVVSKSFYEQLDSYEKTLEVINNHTFIFVVEATRKSSEHACSINDIKRIIENIPPADYGNLKLIVFRQPKRKQETISPVWGRLIYSYEFEGEYHPAIIIEAVDCSKNINWNKSQTPDDQKEFERLKLDGHEFVEGKKYYSSALKIEYVRNTQLYRTLLHEFGHYVHYSEIVEKPGNDSEDLEEWESRYELYLQKSKNEKEKFAHKYADELLKKLQNEKIVPFDKIM